MKPTRMEGLSGPYAGGLGARNFPRIAAMASGKIDSSIYIGKGVTIVAYTTAPAAANASH